MTNSYLLDSLNDAQCRAVDAKLCNQLILAGAGSGKTRVLVHRIAWLIKQHGLSPFEVLAVTFTNKAANEMRSRVEHILDVPARDMWIGTFHGIAHRLLRMHWKDAGLQEGFQILDSDDQQRMIRRIIKNIGIDEEQYPAKKAQWFINGKKDEGLSAQHIPDRGDVYIKTMIKVYFAYEEACERGGVIDFADLLLRVHRLFTNNPELLASYQKRFRYILVDEFQDTNAIQYALIRLLVGKENHVMIVGDDDQSIYGWRGAKIENIHRFSKDYPDAITTRLEQNYRSTGNILSAANSLIAKNSSRLGKNLWTAGDEGEPITVYAGFNDLDEARFIVNKIRDWQREGNELSDVAILYRSNAQSRILEESLMQSGVSYRVYGGLRFFERAEIKDALSYLRLIANRFDDAAFERVVNVPTRGMGDKTVNEIRLNAEENRFSMWQSAQDLLSKSLLTKRASTALTHFLELVDGLAEDAFDLPLHEATEYVIQNSGLIEHFKKEKGERGLARIDNLEELVNAARQFDNDFVDEEISKLSAFISHSALEAGDAVVSGSDNGVQLMTLHSAKGLEFPIVFLCGVEEGLFPHYMTNDDPDRLEEERRLCYVGMTRAMKKLFITYAEIRRLHGKEAYHRPSRFLREIPKEYIDDVRMKSRVSYPESSSQSVKKFVDNDGALQIGQRVKHHKFGEGVVLQYEGHGEHARIQVRFEAAGTKWLIAGFVTT